MLISLCDEVLCLTRRAGVAMRFQIDNSTAVDALTVS